MIATITNTWRASSPDSTLFRQPAGVGPNIKEFLMKTLVIGATGRVAGALARRLVSDGTSVRALVRNREKATAAFGETLEIVNGAFDDRSVLARAFEDADLAFL